MDFNEDSEISPWKKKKLHFQRNQNDLRKLKQKSFVHTRYYFKLTCSLWGRVKKAIQEIRLKWK